MAQTKDVELLRKAGLRATKPRAAVLSHLRKSPYPARILAIAKDVRRSVDQVTVYRTVEALHKAGLVRESNLAGERAFEYASSDDHHHIVCTHCGRIEDFEEPSHEKLAAHVLKKSSFAKITGHSLEFFGLCRACAR